MVRRSVVAIVGSLLLSAMLAPGMAAQKNLEQRGTLSKNCSGLHAGIRAQIIPPYTETPSVMLTFVLLNDSETPVDVGAGSWGIVIDGAELKNSGMLFGNGVTPVGGYRILHPGETYEFGISLPITEYFLPNGQHKVSWRGAACVGDTDLKVIASSACPDCLTLAATLVSAGDNHLVPRSDLRCPAIHKQFDSSDETGVA